MMITSFLRSGAARASTVVVGAATLFGFVAPPAHAGTIPQCGADVCTSPYTINFGSGGSGNEGSGVLSYDAKTGEIWLDPDAERVGGTVVSDGIVWTSGDSTFKLKSIGGNADPEIFFGLVAETFSASDTFTLSLDLPIALAGQIEAKSSLGYTLTAKTELGAQITPILGDHVLVATEVDSDVGGQKTFNKGVDIGDMFFFTGMKTKTTDFEKTNTFASTLDYDLMTVTIAFALSKKAIAGMTGFVTQVVVPVPAALPLLLTGLAGFGLIARRRRTVNPVAA
jgi:hypothetical protein